MLVINGKKVEVPGLESACYLDNPKYGFTNKSDYGFRDGKEVKSVCVHTRMGIRNQPLIHDKKGRNWDRIGVSNANRDDRVASWHISIDSDGSFVCHLDLNLHKAYHAGQCNDHSIGIEMYQDVNGTITYETIESCVKILDVITSEFGIQRQFPVEDHILTRFARDTHGKTKSQRAAYMAGGRSGVDYYGIFGHRNATKNRGVGDPGNHIFEALEKAGYEKFRIEDNEDIQVWIDRQKNYCHMNSCNGIPGPVTTEILEQSGKKHGMWIERPGD